MSGKYITEEEATSTWVAHGGDKDPVGYVTTGRSGLLKFHCQGYYISTEGILKKTLSTSMTLKTYEVDGKGMLLRSEFDDALVELDEIQALAKEEKKRRDEQIAKETPEERAAYVAAKKQLEEMMKADDTADGLYISTLEQAHDALTLALRDARRRFKFRETEANFHSRIKALQSCLEDVITIKTLSKDNVYKYRAEKKALKTATIECTRKLNRIRKLQTRINALKQCMDVVDDALLGIRLED
jgi:hypothetical protein